MKTARVSFEGVAAYSQSRYHGTEKLEKENHSDYEKRTWRERVHVNSDGYILIPPTAFKNSLSEAAKYLSISIPGKGKSNYTKHFEAGIMVTEPVVLNTKKEDVAGEWLFVPSDGKRGGTTRVMKCFPVIPEGEWGGEIVYLILDDTITKKVFEQVVKESGRLIGIGRFRPRNNGYYGRFKVTKIEWS